MGRAQRGAVGAQPIGRAQRGRVGAPRMGRAQRGGAGATPKGLALADLAWPDVAGAPCAAARAVLAVPIGATEQHGPHLPLTTDTDIAVALVKGLADARPDVVAAPPLAYGSSGEHAGFDGTLSIGREAVELVTVELVRSASHSFGRVLLVCAHGGNEAPLRRAVQRLRGEGRDVRAWLPGWSGDAHAGRLETSLMLAIAPERVALERAAAGERAPVAELMPRLVGAGVRAVSPNGVLGDPAGASAAEGRALIAAEIARLAEAVDEWPAG
jgi:mycofactocin system creatininase family protein